MLPETLNFRRHGAVQCNIDGRADASIELGFLFSPPLDSTRLVSCCAQVGLLSFLIGPEASTPPRAPTVLESNCCWPPTTTKKKLCPPLCSVPTVYVHRIHAYSSPSSLSGYGENRSPVPLFSHCFTNAIFPRVLHILTSFAQLSVAFYIILHLALLRN